MLLRLSSFAVTPPIPNTSTITHRAYVMANPARIRRGRQLGQPGQPARSVARQPSPSPAVSRRPPAVGIQPSASSRQPPAQPLSRATRSHRQAIRTVQPTANPSGARKAATDPAALLPMRWPILREMQPQNPPAATLKVINTYVNNLLITC